jgi:hypothetical protein
MLRSALIVALAVAGLSLAVPKPVNAVVMPPAAENAVAGFDDTQGGIEDIRWVRRCHTERRLQWTQYGRRWVPVRICNRVWEPNRNRPWRDRGRPNWRDRGRY